MQYCKRYQRRWDPRRKAAATITEPQAPIPAQTQEKEGYIRLFQIRDYGPNPQPVHIPLSTASKISQKGDILLARYGASLGKVFYAEYGAYNVALAKVIPLYESPLIFLSLIHI